MSAKTERTSDRHPVAEIGIRLLDNAHAAWLTAEVECEQVLERWRERTGHDGYVAYLAALEREEAAAKDLERLWEVARSGHEALAAGATDQ
jgi:hypothetical protein